MIKGIISDLDGTLIRLPINEDEIKDKLRGYFHTNDNLVPLIPSIIKLSPSKTVLENAFSLLCKDELLASNNVKIIDGAKQLIEFILANNFQLNLVTMQCKDAVEKILKKLDLSDCFSIILTRDDIPDRLQQIKEIVKISKINVNEMIVIGDRLHDVICSEKVGCSSILIKEDIKQYKNKIPNNSNIVSNLNDAKNILMNLM